MAKKTREQLMAEREAAYLGKGPKGGVVSPMNPSGMAEKPLGRGHSYSLPGNIDAVPTGNGNGMQPSKYNTLAGPQPPDAISDIDEARNWYSPFQPIAPFGPPSVLYPRTFDYNTGTNLDVVPARMQFFGQLQAMSRGWGLLRTVIETRKDQFLRLPWAFQVRGAPKKQNKRVDELNDFFRRPDGKNRFGTWQRKLLEDLFVIDAPSIYIWEAVTGKPLALEVINGATVKPLIDDAGRRPDYPSPAYQQIIKGLPMTNFDERELMYLPMRPTPQDPRWGYSPVEQIYIEIMSGLKRQLYQLSFWTEGSMPEMIVTVPETWTPQQTAQFQAHFDALMAGNTQLKSRVRFMPGGMKPFDIRNANGEALKSDIDEWNARLVCYAFSVSPTPFIKQMNRATAQNASEAAEEEGLHPLMTWFKDEVMDPIVQEKFGYDELEFNHLPEPEVDPEVQQTVLVGYVKEGLMNRNEARDQLGQGAIPGGDEYTIDTPNGPVPLQESIEAGRAQANAVPDELDREEENHALNVKGKKQDLAAPKQAPPADPKSQKKGPASPPPKGKGVGKAAGLPLQGYQRRLAALAGRGAAGRTQADAGGSGG